MNPEGACLQEQDGRSLTYRQVAELSHRIANGLRAAGIGADSQVGLLSGNNLFTMVAILGIVRSDGVWLPVNARNSAAENANILAQGGCTFLFIDSAFLEQLAVLKEAMPNLENIICIDRDAGDIKSLESWASSQSSMPHFNKAGPDDVVAIRGTGGTTGLPKGVLVTHRVYQAMMANWFAAMPVSSPPVHLVVAPLSHAAGAVAFATMAYGGVNVISRSAKPEDIFEAIGQFAVTQLFLPPTVIYKLLAHPNVRRGNYKSLKYFVYSAAPMSVSKLLDAIDAFGPVMVQCYGQAEAPFICTCLTVDDHLKILSDGSLKHRLSSVGRSSPFVQVAVMGEDGNLLEPGARGELVVKGDLVMKGYFKEPAKTVAAKKHGWLRTGDVGYMDEDGYFYIVDRLKDLIVSGGFNIAPGEIEQVLWTMDAVNDCAVIGVPDPVWGESIKAIVELKPGVSWDLEKALNICREKLGKMKTPRSIEVWESLPRSAVGKVLKREIREQYWKDRPRQV
jgi:acyl-CoA synthetase (AMP-forming)/AMP-acid ligase II